MRTKELSKPSKKAKLATFDDNLKWFHQHCSSNYYLMESAVPMIDIAIFTINHIKRLFITLVANKVKSDLFKIATDYSKAKGNLAAMFIEPILHSSVSY
jgi:hypothetical protein